ncbi:hypothetical protein PV10_03243 [Exophiala mesophila]|uniref:Uncharacterized protein n=1 Tax=Exophiala mesophila TaxID=212818 RepID=A0A0D2A9I0_EXOME|nr:uncharacterized protein PV10_03243 [Exophiala mesophila]KIV95613.1 hypothetical protein PV10_03243 [Exophiala mesophila]
MDLLTTRPRQERQRIDGEIQVFVPFDVGDSIDMTGQEFEVVRISLLYTVFRRIEPDTIVQVANSVVGALFIDNVSRSDAMRERYQFSTPENCRDFQPDVDIQLVSLADLKQLDLRVDIKHKSNWANDQLRAYRRSKFLYALLSATRKVPIYSPAGAGPDRGSMEAPNYNVPIAMELAQNARQKWDRDQEGRRLKRPVRDDDYVPNVANVPDISIPLSQFRDITQSETWILARRRRLSQSLRSVSETWRPKIRYSSWNLIV